MGSCCRKKNLNWKEIYSKVFDTYKGNKLQNFQYNLTHRNIATNKYLLKCRYAASSLCTFCNMAVESIDHLFWDCDLIQHFWNNLFDVLAQCNLNVARNKFGVFLHANSQISSYIYSFDKFYSHQCKFKNVITNIDAFKTKLRYRKILEQHIAIKMINYKNITIRGTAYKACRRHGSYSCESTIRFVFR